MRVFTNAIEVSIQPALFLIFLFAGGCSTEQLSSCWSAEAFEDGQRVEGDVTLLVSLPPKALRYAVPTYVLVTPRHCENGSFVVENPAQFDLFKLATPYREDDKVLGTAINATVTGKVRIDYSEVRLSHGASPRRIILSSVSNLRPIARPAWMKP